MAVRLISLFIWLVAGHAFGDFALQGDTMAEGKNRHHDPALHGVNWWYWLGSHAIVHGGIVGFITGSTVLGLAEAVAHFAIDYGKCEEWYDIHLDQALHVACKFLWAVILVYALIP
jgi:Protein of unknown function (DUF3307)